MERFTMEGNLTRDPERKVLDSGVVVVSISVACDYLTGEQNGERDKKVSFYDVDIWRELGEHVAASLAKGDRIMLEGRCRQDRWEQDDPANPGQKVTRSRVRFTADAAGTSLRWATATPVKTNGNRSNNGDPLVTGAEEFAEEPF